MRAELKPSSTMPNFHIRAVFFVMDSMILHIILKVNKLYLFHSILYKYSISIWHMFISYAPPTTASLFWFYYSIPTCSRCYLWIWWVNWRRKCARGVHYLLLVYIYRNISGQRAQPKKVNSSVPCGYVDVNARVLSPDIIPRSNNSHEAFNRSMTNSIPRIHPNIWLLITNLKKEETLAQMKRTHYERGDIKTPGKKYATIK